MADQLDSDSAPQRKRIAVAVSSREAPIRPDASDFGYSVGDARVYASRTPVGGGIPYSHDSSLPTLGSNDVLGSFRSSSAYAYTPATKAYYPAMHAYGTPYPDEFEFGLGVSSPSVMHQEPVGMLPGQWSSGAGTRPAAKPSSFSSIYLDTDGPYSSYHGAGLLHRPPHSVSADSPNFSFSGVAASLPMSSTPGPERLLPNPAARSSSLPYPATLKSSASSTTSAASTLADVATAASYAGGFNTPGLPYSSTTSSSLSSHHSSSSRSNSDTYSAHDGIFSEQERNSIQSQGPGFEMSSYTASPRRSSLNGGGAGGPAAGSGSSSHTYVPGESASAAAAHHHHLPGPYMDDAAAPSGLDLMAHRRGQAADSGSGSASHAAHAEDRQVAVASRH
ncbi:604209c1-e117-43f5-bd0c-95c8b4518ad5 [Thermothielavioides terrestris]|uniref:604209c1-e117-43f5-bd0c-95c8b4518ad5 n=1 Tax=Thermothielavioides terrestris TaxID=2587410 RepID=A0A3S4ALM8_9PEZI|nr:604209c1-e117-43f5-bd0c-95c8b4518ad5 [Thermothielavioides terrestris]